MHIANDYFFSLLTFLGLIVNIRVSAVLASLVILLSGCMTPPQYPVAMAPQALATPGTRIGIVMTALPALDTQFPGADCLLCFAAASIANSSMTDYTRKLTYEDLPELNKQLMDVLQKRGAAVTIIDTVDFKSLPDFASKTGNFARQDFTGLKAKHNIDKLVVIAINFVGVQRNYASYIPTSDPKARVSGVSYLVNLNDNALEWYHPLDVQKASDAQWDEPPTFPGLTNAYFQTLEMTKDQVLKPFRN